MAHGCFRTRIRRRRVCAWLVALLCFALPVLAEENTEESLEEIIPPQWEVPDYVTWLLEIAGGSGYREGGSRLLGMGMGR